MTFNLPFNYIDQAVNWIAWIFFTGLTGLVFVGNIKDMKNIWVIFDTIAFFFLVFLAVNYFTQWIVII